MLIDFSREDRVILMHALTLFINSTPATRSDNLAAQILLNRLKTSGSYTGSTIDSTTVYTSPTAQDDYTPWF